MSQGKEYNKNPLKNKEKKTEQVRDRSRAMRNSLEKGKNEIPQTDDRSKQSSSEKAPAKPQATQDSSTSNSSKLDIKRKVANEENVTGSNKEERKKDVGTKAEEESSTVRLSKRSRKVEKISEEEKEQQANGVDSKAPASSVGSRSHASGLNEDTPRNLRSKIDFTPGARLEARDFTERWYAAKVVEVDWEEEEVLVHFEKWSSRFDEWISMDSPRLRPPTLPSNSSKSKTTQFKEGEKVMAFWLDRQKYPAKVMKVLPNDNYEIMFFDGYSKTITGKRMAKATEKEIEKAKKEMPMPVLPGSQEGSSYVPSTSIFSDTDIGTKEDRRRRKRKLNVAGLFSKNYRQSATKKEAQQVKKAMDESIKEQENVPQDAEKSNSKVDLQNDEESPEEGRLVYDSEDEAEEEIYSPPPSDSVDESSSPPRGKGMRTKFKAPSKDIKETPESSRKRKIPAVDDSSTDFLRLRFKSRKTTPGTRKRVEPPPEKEVESKVVIPEQPTTSRKQVKEPIHVPDKKLPSGWRKFAIRRKIGASAGKWDIYMQSPEGRKIRSPHALRAFFAKRGVDHINLDRFDFAPSKAVFPRDGGRPALALSAEEIRAMDEEKASAPQKQATPGPPMRLSAGGPKVLLPKVVQTGSTTPKRLKTLLPRARGTSGDFSGEPPLPSEHNTQTEIAEGGEALWKETNCKMDSTFVCPKEGCCKNFRKENLLQMHIKHYHPEYCKLVGSAPNVADLASARMDGGESVFDFRPARARTSPMDPTIKGRGRGRWGGVRRGGGVSRTSESHSATSPEQKNVAETPAFAEPDARWEARTSTPTIKTLLPVRPSDPQPEGTLPPSPVPVELDTITDDGVQLVQEVVTETPVIPAPIPPRRLMGVGRRKRRLTFLPSHMAKRRKFAMKTSSVQGDVKPNVEEKSGESETVVSSQKGSVNIKRHPASVGDGKVPVVQLQKLKVTTDSQGRVILCEPQRKTSQGSLRKGVKPQTAEEEREGSGERTTISGLAGSSGSCVRRRRKRKSELLSREEIVNCVCGSPEEDGLMMQCELCLCWQHGHCNNIEREVEVPEKYICYICLNPLKERKSMRYFHDQDWLKKGVLPSLSFHGREDDGRASQRFRVLKKSHELTGSLHQLKTVVHSLRVKVNMIGNTDHPKLYLWSKSWESSASTNDMPDTDAIKEEDDHLETPSCTSKANSHYGDITKTEDNLPELTMEQGTIDEKDGVSSALDFETGGAVHDLCVKEEPVDPDLSSTNEIDMPKENKDVLDDHGLNDSTNEMAMDTSATLTASSEDLKQDQMNEERPLDVGDVALSADSTRMEADMLQEHPEGEDDCPPVLELPLSQSELQQLANTVEDKLRATEVRAPQPEAPIDPMECQLTLLDHIESMQQEVDSRLTLIEAQVAALEAEDDDIASDESPEFYPHTKQTIQMIMRDLNTARRIAAFCGKT